MLVSDSLSLGGVPCVEAVEGLYEVKDDGIVVPILREEVVLASLPLYEQLAQLNKPSHFHGVVGRADSIAIGFVNDLDAAKVNEMALGYWYLTRKATFCVSLRSGFGRWTRA